ncbi:MAG: ABC transporter ATP-binding protein [Clostridiales bacterium]|nr:ABC transporter ATP-binding protein [Clostridiales bacterium]
MLKVENLGVSYGDLKILDGLSFTLEQGQWLMIAGPNGAGKSTVLRALSRGCRYTGQISLKGRDIKRFKPHILAQKLGFLSQRHEVTYPFKVREVVALGRYAHSKNALYGGAAGDEEKVSEALSLTGLSELAEKSVLELSGGELQRTFIAQLFAQDPDIIVLDEPTNSLDLIYQKQVFQLIEGWIKKEGRAVISVVHDLSLARLYGTKAILLDRGRVVAMGQPEKVISEKYLNPVYSMDVSGYMREILSTWQRG